MNNNLFLDELKSQTNFTETENGAIAHTSTLNRVYDLFAFGGAYRKRSDADCIVLFANAYNENPAFAVKALFYLRDIRGGQGERRFFRVCFRWLCENHPEHARKLVRFLPEYGRYDDLWETTIDTELWRNTIAIVEDQLALDLDSNTPSLLAKWLPSENASSYHTKFMAKKISKSLGISNKEYRKDLKILRDRIKVVEKLMSENRWDEIQFDKIPSKAGLIYKNAFARRDVIAKKYETFIKSEKTSVNTKTLYPYEIVAKVVQKMSYWDGDMNLSELDRITLEKYWNNLPNYLEGGHNQSILCVVDTSGSMCGNKASAPINVAISLGMYAAERCTGPFKDHYISFSSKPQLIHIEGVDFSDKVNRIYQTNLCSNTNLAATFDLLKETALSNPGAAADMPSTIVVISDMEIDNMSYTFDESRGRSVHWTRQNTKTEMERIREDWAAVGLKLPNLVYWNVDARNNTILDSGDSVSFVSGFSPIIFQQVIKGVKGKELMMNILESDRYKDIK
jgi:hypothetical protein